MRYVPTNCIAPGTVLGQTLYNHSGSVLLTGGSVIKNNYIMKIKELGVKGIFIDDEISNDINVYNAISEELRQESVKGIRKMFQVATNSNDRNFVKKFNKQTEIISKVVENIVDDILSNKDLINNLSDIKVFDEYTYYHCTNVAVLSVVIGIGLDKGRDDLKKLAMCGILHDIGKVFMDNNVLNKPTQLTDEEFTLIKSHSVEGYNYVNGRQKIDYVVAQGILDHHEKFDGTGYPYGKSGKSISEFGRIITLADVYDALTSDRVYRKALSSADAIEYIMAGNDVSFDPDIVRAFIKKVDPYPVGTPVALSNGDVGIVTSVNPTFPMRPNIRVFMHKNAKIQPYEVSLANDINSLNIIIIGVAEA